MTLTIFYWMIVLIRSCSLKLLYLNWYGHSVGRKENHFVKLKQWKDCTNNTGPAWKQNTKSHAEKFFFFFFFSNQQLQETKTTTRTHSLKGKETMSINIRAVCAVFHSNLWSKPYKLKEKQLCRRSTITYKRSSLVNNFLSKFSSLVNIFFSVLENLQLRLFFSYAHLFLFPGENLDK